MSFNNCKAFAVSKGLYSEMKGFRPAIGVMPYAQVGKERKKQNRDCHVSKYFYQSMWLETWVDTQVEKSCRFKKQHIKPRILK